MDEKLHTGTGPAKQAWLDLREIKASARGDFIQGSGRLRLVAQHPTGGRGRPDQAVSQRVADLRRHRRFRRRRLKNP